MPRLFRIPINDLKRQSRAVAQEIAAATSRVVERGWYLVGPELEAFESEFAAYCGVPFCVGVANGTDSLELALRALDIRAGDLVATVANAGLYSTTAIRTVGATPVYVDVDLATMLMDSSSLGAALAAPVKAIVVTHLYGRMAGMKSLLELAGSRGIPVIEDCAQAHGAHLARKVAGSWGAIGCFSFYPTKNLGALGDAGALVTSNVALADRLRQLRQYGWKAKYHSESLGCNSRMDEIQAAYLRVKLTHLNDWNRRRVEIAKTYSDGLAGSGLNLPAVHAGDYVAHLYVVRTQNRDALKSALSEMGIEAQIHYPVPDHCQPWVRDIVGEISLPCTTQACAEVLSLPCYPELSDAEVEQVIHAVSEVCQDRAYAQRGNG